MVLTSTRPMSEQGTASRLNPNPNPSKLNTFQTWDYCGSRIPNCDGLGVIYINFAWLERTRELPSYLTSCKLYFGRSHYLPLHVTESYCEDRRTVSGGRTVPFSGFRPNSSAGLAAPAWTPFIIHMCARGQQAACYGYLDCCRCARTT
jgi:hypothetical protein